MVSMRVVVCLLCAWLLAGCATVAPKDEPTGARTVACYAAIGWTMPFGWVSAILWAPVTFALDAERARQGFEELSRGPCE